MEILHKREKGNVVADALSKKDEKTSMFVLRIQ